MASEKWERVKELFNDALELAPAERSSFLAAACAADATLREEVESLIALQAEAATFIETPALEDAFKLVRDERPQPAVSPRLGNYEIIRELGRGGMGAVYLAARADDQYKKQVAIKVVKQGLDRDFIIQRFLSERQILANLDHPHIARLLDGGTTEGGSPYLVMEYVEGLPIDAYCDRHKLSVVERLRVFRAVCSAVQYAHRNLVIHRDIKPSNILIAADGEPKLLDFGIAKLLAPSSQAVETTASYMRLMTPAYASPEQARGLPVTTASDVYTLGVVLYELLTGRRPYRVAVTSPLEMVRIICEEEPEKPSTAVNCTHSDTDAHRGGQTQEARAVPATVSELRKSQPEKLRRELAGDLDNIILKAIRKEPEHRYDSVEQFSEDIRRYLEGLPVIASRDTFNYRAGKFIRRNKVAVVAVAVVVLSLLAGVITTTWQARVARAERARAEQRFNEVRQLANSFLFEFHDGIEKLPGSTPMRELVVRRALEYLDSLAREAGNDSGLQNEMATAYERVGNIQSSFGWANRGDTAGALESYRKALAIREALAAVSPQQSSSQLALAAALGKVGQTLIHTHDFQGAADSFRRAQSLLEPTLAREPHHADARRQLRGILTLLGQALSEQGQSEQAMDSWRQALRLAEEEIAQNPADHQARRGMAAILYEMGYLLLGTKDNAEAVTLYRRSLAICKELAEAAPHDPQTRRDLALAYDQLGSALYEAGDLVGELENYRASLRLREELAAAEPASAQARNDLATGYYNLGYALAQKGETAAGVATYRKAVALMEAVSAANPANARFRAKVAMFYVYFGKLWEMLATRDHVPTATRRQHWEAARSWYQRALMITNEMRAQNLSTGSAVSTPEQLANHIARCESALAKGNMTSPRP